MSPQGIGWAVMLADGVAVSGPALMWGVVVYVKDDEKEFEIYDGLDSGSGRLVLQNCGDKYVMTSVMFPKPLRIDNGIYVVMDDDYHNVTVLWEPR